MAALCMVGCLAQPNQYAFFQPHHGIDWTANRKPLPLKVYWDDAFLGEAQGEALEWAMRQWPCEAFVRVGSVYDADIEVVEAHGGFTAFMDMSPRNEIDRMLVNPSVFPWYSTHNSALIFQHELGHALGLQHWPSIPRETAENWIPIMVQNLADHWGRFDNGKLAPFLHPANRAALTERYCK